MDEKKTKPADAYREAYERYKTYRPTSLASASARLGREESHERRRPLIRGCEYREMPDDQSR